MSPDAVLGIDLGTSLVKVAVHALDGAVLAAAGRPVPLHHLGSGHVEQDMDDFYTAAAEATRECVGAAGLDPARIGAVAVAGQMAGVGLVDADHRPAAPFDSWLDTRCGDVVADLADRLGERILTTAGCAPTISIGPKMAWWVRERPDVVARSASFVTAAGYVAGRAVGLRGGEAYIDASHLHFASFADVAAVAWDAQLVAAAGVPERLLPRIVESTGVVGALTAEAAADFGLAPGTSVAAGCGDTAAGALGAGVTEPGQAFDIAGTAAVLGVCLTRFAADAAGTLLTMRAALPGRWYALAYVGGAGQVIEWACREVLGHAAVDDAAYAELGAAAAAAPPGSDGLVVSPHFSGRVAPVAPAARGAVVGLTPTHTRSHLARATLESIAFEYRGYVDAARTAAPDLAVTAVTGTGGGSRSAVWNAIKADVLGVPYTPVHRVEAGTRGAALVALAALGHPAPALDPAALGTVARPDPHRADAYAEAQEHYRAWTEHLVAGYRLTAQRRAARQAGPGAPASGRPAPHPLAPRPPAPTRPHPPAPHQPAQPAPEVTA